MIERNAQVVGCRRNPFLNRQLSCQLDEVASMPIDKCLASLLIYSYSFDSKTFSLGHGFPTKCCVDRLKSQSGADTRPRFAGLGSLTSGLEPKAATSGWPPSTPTIYISVCSAISNASSTSIPRYLTVLSSFRCPKSS